MEARESKDHLDSMVLWVTLDLPDLQDIMVPRAYLDLGPVPVFTILHPALVW